MANEHNDEVLNAALESAIEEMKDDPFAWFEHRGIQKEAAMEFADMLSIDLLLKEGMIPATIVLTAFVAGYSLHEGRTDEILRDHQRRLT